MLAHDGAGKINTHMPYVLYVESVLVWKYERVGRSFIFVFAQSVEPLL